MKQAVLYARVSSKEQEREGFSIPAQIKLLKEYAAKQNIKIVAQFVEAETAKKSGRKQFNEMIKFLKKSKSVRSILVEKTDRLYRNLKDYVTIDEVEDLEIHFAKEATILSKNSRSQDKFMHGIRVLMAKNYIDNLSEEIKKGIKEKAEQGYYPSKAPVGYKNITEPSGRRIVVPDEETAIFIKRAFELYAAGTYSFKSLAKQLHDDGFRPHNRPCTKRTIELIFNNRFYIGEFDFNGKRYTNAQHTPLISKELFFAVQKRREDTGSPKKIAHDFPYTNLIKCSKCGCYFTAEIKKGKYIYYHCTGNRGGKCKQKYLKQEHIDEACENMLKQLHTTQEEIDQIISIIKEMFKMSGEYEENSMDKINSEIQKYKKRLNQLYLDKIDGIIDEDFFIEKKSAWQDELDKLEIKYKSIMNADRTLISNAELILKICKDAHRLFSNQPVEEKRKILNLLCSNFLYDGHNISVELKSTFKPMLKSAKIQKTGAYETRTRDPNTAF